MQSHQLSLHLIDRRLDSSIIQQRASDGYINATELCNVAGKRWWNYLRTESTGQFLRALSARHGIPYGDLVQEVRNPQGVASTWIHPLAAINLGQWLSGVFAVKVSEWVHDWLEGKPAAPRAPTGALPYHIERHMLNVAKIPTTHFSILQEMTFTLIAPMEVHGYTLPGRMVPDISQGKLFCKFLREELGVDTDSLPVYEHAYPDGRCYEAKLYPVEHLPAFRRFIADKWMPERAAKYFQERDPAALPYLDRILLAAPKVAPKLLPPRTPRGAAGNKSQASRPA